MQSFVHSTVLLWGHSRYCVLKIILRSHVSILPKSSSGPIWKSGLFWSLLKFSEKVLFCGPFSSHSLYWLVLHGFTIAVALRDALRVSHLVAVKIYICWFHRAVALGFLSKGRVGLWQHPPPLLGQVYGSQHLCCPPFWKHRLDISRKVLRRQFCVANIYR